MNTSASGGSAEDGRSQHRLRGAFGDQLDGADLRSVDLRGIDFSGSSLRNADLRGARTGRTRPWSMLVVLVAVAASMALGAVAGIAGRFLQQLFVSDDLHSRFVGVLVAAAVVVVIASSIWKGLAYAIRHTLSPIAALAVISGAIAIFTGLGTGSGAMAALAFLALVVAVLGLGALARALAGTVSMLLFAVAALSGALVGNVLGGGLTAVIVAIASVIIGQRALAGSRDYPLLVRWIDDLACLGGTRFRGADLTGARFDDAHLECTDFRGAVLEGTRFDGARIRQCVLDSPPRDPGAQPPKGSRQPRSTRWTRALPRRAS